MAASALRVALRRGFSPTRAHLMVGTCPHGGLFAPVAEYQVVDTVRTAVLNGITHFDTAPHYGLGVAEERIGTAIGDAGADLCASPVLQEMEAVREFSKLHADGVLCLYTKSGRIVCSRGTPGAFLQTGGTDITGVSYYDLYRNASLERDQLLDFSAAGAGRSLGASEARLGHRVAGLRVHDPDSDELVDACLEEDGHLAGLRALRSTGRIERVSLGMNMVAAPLILRLLREAPDGTFDDIMLAHGWNLLCTDGSDVIAECQQRGIEIHNAGVYASGLLVGGDTYFYSEAPDGMKAKTAAWSKLAQSYEVPLPAVAIAFGLLPEAVTHVVCGMRSPAEVLQAIEWTEAPVPQALWADAHSMGLLPDGAESLMSASEQILPDAREN